MAARTPVPTPRRSQRNRQPPQRYEDYVAEFSATKAVPQHATDDQDCRSEASSAITAVSTSSRRSVISVRAAALRVERLRQEHELQRRSEDAARALELHRACSELEMATLTEEEQEQSWRERSSRIDSVAPEPALLPGIAEEVQVQDRRERAPRIDRAAPQSSLVPAALNLSDSDREQHGAASERRQTEQLDLVSCQPPRAAPVTATPMHVTISHPPKMDILAFDGCPEKYPFFKMQVSEVRASGNFTDLQITQHLRERLRGDAFETVHGTLLSGGSLDRILHALDSRFGNPFIITQAVTEKVMNRPKVRSNDVRDLSKFCAEIYNVLSILEAVGYQSELDNYGTLSSLVEKLPPESQLGWGGFARAQVEAGQPLTCQLLYDYITAHLKDRQFGAPKSKRFERDARQRSYAATEVKEQPRNRERRSSKTNEASLCCFYCNKSHWIAQCDSFRGLNVEERWRWTMDNKCCVRCLSTRHNTSDCHRMRSCGIEGCREEHHRLLHRPKVNKTQIVGALSDRHKYATMMKTVTIDVTGPSKTKRCVAYLDEGSSITLISQNLAEEIGCRGRPHNLRMKTMCGTSEQQSRLVDVTIGSLKTGKKHRLADVVAIPVLALDKNPVTVKSLGRKYELVKKLDIPELDEDPQILIGIDNADLIATRQILRTTKNGPLLQRTELGWTVTGRVVVTADTGSQPVHFIGGDEPSRDLDDLVRSTWETESFGCKFQRDCAFSPEDQEAEKLLDREVYHNGSRWVVPLLRKNREESFPESRRMAEKRAINFEKRLDSSEKNQDNECPNLAGMCYSKMDQMVKDGHVRKLTTEEAEFEPSNTWYLPLLAVQNANKPGKVRLVLDAAAKSHGKCLNDFLMRGPDYFNLIPGIILRWREKPVAITSDVVAMFSQVLVKPSDRASLRFLWRGRRRDGPFDVYESSTVIFGSKSSPSTAGYCYRKTGECFSDGKSEVLTVIRDDTYVDDVITGAETSEEAAELIQDLTSTLRGGGFELGPWASNSSEVLKTLPSDLRAEGDIMLEDGALGQRALGVIWSPETDELTYKAKVAPEATTKRTLLSHVMSVFDPVGLLCGWLLTVRLLLQRLWKENLAWDSPLPEEQQKEYRQWAEELQQLDSIRIPRHVFNHEAGIKEAEMHVFCDASQKAICAVAYFRWKQPGKINVGFVTARSRVAPVKTLTIPRLELQAAVLGTRLAGAVQRDTRLRISSTTFWTDSKNVLAWIKANDRRYHVFVANRVAEIRESTVPDQWRYVPTDINAADGGSRGHGLLDLREDGIWVSGPDFLRTSEDKWPRTDGELTTDVLQNDPETRLVLATSPESSPDIREAMPDAARFSRWTVAVRTVTVIQRWKRKTFKKGESQEADAFSEAERLWMKLVQKQKYGPELQDMEDGIPLSKTSVLANLSPVLIDGLICVDTRTKRSPEISCTARHPPILARDHPYTQLLIQYLHGKMGHRAHDAVLVELRQRCWVPQAAREIRKVAAKCQICRIRKSQPCRPRMAPLPKSRVTMLGGAFMATGVDYFGPLHVRRGRTMFKLWGVIFRCFATRAVHIELAESLDTNSALLAISRFQARRGNVKQMWSDNGANLKRADRELKTALQALDQEKLKDKLRVDNISWCFNPPGDPEAGGVWERQIRTVKETLHALLNEQRPSYEVLSTLLCEVEKIMNSTPLFHVPVEPYDEDVLTPFHFLIGRATPSYPTGAFSAHVDLKKRWHHAQKLADHFWQRWVREYLPTLTQRTKWHKSSANVETGDVVIVVDQRHPRGIWPKGIVEKTYPGADGVVRSVEVRTVHGRLHRPVRKIVILPVIRR